MKRHIVIGPDTKICSVGGRPPRIVLILLVEQIGMFLLWAFADGPKWFDEHLAASAQQCLGHLALWQPITALLIHVGTRGLLLNMLSLWIFGSSLERWWGPRRFLLFWSVTGVLGLGLGVLLGQVLDPTHVLAGSAGSAAAMLVAFGLIFPQHMVFFYRIMPLKARPLAFIFFGFILVGSLIDRAFLELTVQLGGAAVAVLFLRRPRSQPQGAQRRNTQAIGPKKKEQEHYWN